MMCTTHQVGPHAPGPFKVKITLTEPGSDAAVKSRERSLDLVVARRYLGAFRIGIAGIVGAPDRKFEPRTAPGSMTPEIARTEAQPVELVLGYSVYFSALGDGQGRSYFAANGQAMQDSHWGAFIGFGVATYSESNIDYLKSLHLGLEYEIGPSVSIAVTGVVRRVIELIDGASVGAPAGTSIPTQQSYALGAAVVINTSAPSLIGEVFPSARCWAQAQQAPARSVVADGFMGRGASPPMMLDRSGACSSRSTSRWRCS